MTDATTQNPFAPPRALVEDRAGEHLALVTATRGSRFLAVLIDMSPALVFGIVAAIMVPGMLLTGTFDTANAGGALMTLGALAFVFLALMVGWIVWTVVLVYRYGQTVGKKVMGIRVVRMDGSRVSFPRFLFLRWLAMAFIGGVIGGIAGAMHMRYVGNLMSLVDALFIFGPACRCLHDYVADTQVVTAASSQHATLEGSQAL